MEVGDRVMTHPHQQLDMLDPRASLEAVTKTKLNPYQELNPFSMLVQLNV
jgi:hypothetical protein